MGLSGPHVRGPSTVLCATVEELNERTHTIFYIRYEGSPNNNKIKLQNTDVVIARAHGQVGREKESCFVEDDEIGTANGREEEEEVK